MKRIILIIITLVLAVRITKAQSPDTTVYVVPLVFHILHDFGPEQDIPDSVIINAVKNLNRNFRKLRSDTSQIDPAFKSISADCRIEFRLAHLDPNGNCTNGINRVATVLSYGTYGGSFIWPSNKYLNIYTLSTWSKPASAWIGRITWQYETLLEHWKNSEYIFTHEMGHALGLEHTFNWTSSCSSETNCLTQGDNICDTPPTTGNMFFKGNNHACIGDQPENFMDYAEAYSKMFTKGQKDRMRTVLKSPGSNYTSNLAQGGYDSIFKQSNLIATGTDNAGTLITCPPPTKPVAGFYASRDDKYNGVTRPRVLCIGSKVVYKNRTSWNGPTGSLIWSFPGGSPSSSTTNDTVTVTYNTPGVYSVQLIVTNTSGSNSIIADSLITISSNPLPTVSYIQNPNTVCLNGTLNLSGGAPSVQYASYEGTGVVNGNKFIASVAGIGTTKITYHCSKSYLYNSSSVYYKDAYCTNSASQNITVTALPTTPTITVNSGAICVGYIFTMTPGGANNYTFSSGTYSYTFSSGTIVQPTVNSTYTITGSNLGCLSTGSAISNVTVNASPIITANSGSVCSGKSFTIVPGGANTYTISGGQFVPPLAISGGSQIVSPLVSTTYYIAGTSAAGCNSNGPAISKVTLSASPTITVNSGAICSSKSFTMVPNGANSYSFSSGSAIVSPTANASYSIIGTSTAGCISSNTAVSNITVNITPTVTVNSGAICIGKSFTMNPGGANTYTFSNGSAIVNPIINSSYSVTGTSSKGCVSSNTAVANVTVNNNPTISVNSGSICSGENFTIIPSGANTYTIQGANNVISPLVSTNYTVAGTSTAGCISNNVATSSVSVFQTPTVIAVNSTSNIICIGQSATLTANGASSYIWNPGGTGSVIIISPTINTTYTLTGIGINNCSNTAVITQSVSVCNNIVTLTGVEASYINIYPNPTNEILNIELEVLNKQGETLQILNALGQLIAEENITNNNVTLNIKNYEAGIYFIKIGNLTKKVIKG